jgi:hypothetical protein
MNIDAIGCVTHHFGIEGGGFDASGYVKSEAL